MKVELHPVRYLEEGEEVDGIEEDDEFMDVILCSIEEADEFLIFTSEDEVLTWQASFRVYEAAQSWASQVAEQLQCEFVDMALSVKPANSTIQ